MPLLPNFVGPTGAERSHAVDASRTINLYLQESSSQRGNYVLYGFPGLLPVCLLPSGPIRGLYEATNGRVFAATSTTLFEVFAGWSFLARGTISTGTGPASFTDDGSTLVLSVDGVGYAMPFATNVLATLPLTGPQTFGRMQYIDGRIVTNEPGTRRFWYTDILAATTWPALNFYQAEARADLIVTLYIDHRELYVLGTQSIEIWTSTGDALSPFARSSAVFLEQGIAAPWAVHALDNTLFFLGGSPRGEGPVWSLRGYEPVRVSTHATEAALSTADALSEAQAFVARHGGHAFYFLSVPSLETTWAYDVAVQGWTEMAELLDDGSLAPWRATTHCLAFGEHAFGDRGSGQIYVWSPDYFKYGMDPMYRARMTSHVRRDQKPVRYSAFELVMETGIGLDGGVVPGSDPQVMLSWSDDGGAAWTYPRWRSAGGLGRRERRVVWRQLGRAPTTRCFKVVVTDPVFTAFLGASVEVA